MPLGYRFPMLSNTLPRIAVIARPPGQDPSCACLGEKAMQARCAGLQSQRADLSDRLRKHRGLTHRVRRAALPPWTTARHREKRRLPQGAPPTRGGEAIPTGFEVRHPSRRTARKSLTSERVASTREFSICTQLRSAQYDIGNLSLTIPPEHFRGERQPQIANAGSETCIAQMRRIPRLSRYPATAASTA